MAAASDQYSFNSEVRRGWWEKFLPPPPTPLHHLLLWNKDRTQSGLYTVPGSSGMKWIQGDCDHVGLHHHHHHHDSREMWCWNQTKLRLIQNIDQVLIIDQWLPPAPRDSQRLPAAPSGSHWYPETPRDSQRLPLVPSRMAAKRPLVGVSATVNIQYM